MSLNTCTPASAIAPTGMSQWILYDIASWNAVIGCPLNEFWPLRRRASISVEIPLSSLQIATTAARLF